MTPWERLATAAHGSSRQQPDLVRSRIAADLPLSAGPVPGAASAEGTSLVRRGLRRVTKSTIVRAHDDRGWCSLVQALALFASLYAGPTAAAAASPPPLPEPAAPLAVTEAMRSWSAAHVGGGAPLERLRELHGATTAHGTLSIAPVTEPTPSAAEAFATRRADCVGYALLLVALSREAGIDTRFALWRTLVGVDETDSLHVRRGHLVVVYAGRAFDLDGETQADAARVQLVSDRTALALFFSNRSAQSLALGRPVEAVELGWRAVRYDPSLTSVWSNLGVALRRVGDTSGAVLAYEMALRLDPSDRSVRRNLAVARGRR